MELAGPSLPLRETLQSDDTIVLKWQILFARVYKNTFDPTLHLHVYDTEMCVYVCVWGGGHSHTTPFSPPSLSTWCQPERFKVKTTAFTKQGLCVDVPNCQLTSLNLSQRMP